MLLVLIFLINIFIFFIFYTFEKENINKFSKYLVWGYLFIYPVLNTFIPDYKTSIVIVSLDRIFFHLSFMFNIVLILKYRYLEISTSSRFILIYSLYFFIISIYNHNFIPNTVLNYLYPIMFIILLDNIEFNVNDRIIFNKLVHGLLIVIFIVICIQMYKPYFYTGVDVYLNNSEDLYSKKIYNIRHQSIFTGNHYTEAGLNIAVISLIIIQIMKDELNIKNITFTIIAIVSVLLTFTRSNYIFIVIGLSFFIIFNKKLCLLSKLLILILLCLSIYFFIDASELQRNDFVYDRILASTYLARFERLEIFMSNMINEKLVFGYGIDSLADFALFKFSQYFSELHNGYLEILYRTGLIGFILYFMFWYEIHKRGRNLYRKYNDIAIISFITSFILINFIYKYIKIGFWGFLLIVIYLKIHETTIITDDDIDRKVY